MVSKPCGVRLVAALLVVSCANVARADRGDDVASDLEDGAYLTACGPIACYVALKAVGVDTSLREMAGACGWRNGELTTLEAMRGALLGTRAVGCDATRVPVGRLAELVGEGRSVAILPIRKGGEEINHAVCVVRARENRFWVIDYPELGSWKSAAQLADVWDGEVLLVARKAPGWYWRENAWWFSPSAAALGTVLLVWAARGERRKAAATRSPSLARTPDH